MTQKPGDDSGLAELRGARAAGAGLLVAVAVFSVTVNLLMLTGPLFMLQVYDRVLGSSSVETLAALFLLVMFLFFIMGMVDLARSRVMQRVALGFHHRLERRVYQASLAEGAATGSPLVARGGMRDLETLRSMAASPVILAFFDLPFAPLFLGAICIFHPLLGVAAIAGGAVLILGAVLNQLLGKHRLREASLASHQAERMAETFRREGELIGALGMHDATFARWRGARAQAATAGLRSADKALFFTSFSRSFRLFLQSALLATGAWLVLRQELTPGAMIASSIMMGRALQPVETVVGQWANVQRAQDSWSRLAGLLSRHPPPPPHTALPRPEARIEVTQLAIIPPGQRSPALRNVSFSLSPGQALGVIGPSGSGKSTLARALIGAWPPAAGAIRLGGATLDQFGGDRLGQLIGYLPQQVTLFEGTVAENIARLDPDPDATRVVQAARAAAAHDMILNLPQGYDTRLTQMGGQLSGGQIQRIGLARALYSNPVLLVLDEPNSNLDNEGSQALNAAIRQVKSDGGAVIIMAHRPAAIAECEVLLVLDKGTQRAFGKRDEVLKSALQNAHQIQPAASKGSVT